MSRKKCFNKAIHSIYRLVAIIIVLGIVLGLPVSSEAARKGALNRTRITLHVGSSYYLSLTGATAVSWKSSKKTVAKVNSKGKVTAKKKGTVTITCTDKNGKKYKCKVTVKNHNYRITKVISAKKNKKGYICYECSDCKKTYQKETVYSPSESKVRKDILSLKKKYPEGKKWTTANHYTWGPDIYYDSMSCIGGGCVAFAFMASDAAFGKFNKSRKISGQNWYDNIRAGDIIRVEDGTHSVVVLEKKKNSIVVVEGAYNDSVHWGRELSMNYIKKHGRYLITRYPE